MRAKTDAGEHLQPLARLRAGGRGHLHEQPGQLPILLQCLTERMDAEPQLGGLQVHAHPGATRIQLIDPAIFRKARRDGGMGHFPGHFV